MNKSVLITLLIFLMVISSVSAYDQSIYNSNAENNRFLPYNGDINYPAIKWHSVFEREINTPVLISDINKDNKKEVIFGSGNTIYVLNSSGKLEWSTSVGANIKYSFAIMNLNNTKHIIVAAEKYLYSLSNNGSIEWKKVLENAVTFPPIVKKVPWDKNPEIFLSVNYPLAMNYQGNVLWKDSNIETREFSLSSFDSNSSLDLIAGNGKLYDLNAKTGAINWEKKITLSSFPTIKSNYIYFRDHYSKIHKISKKGQESWVYSNNAQYEPFSHENIVVADVNSDGIDDVIFTQGTELFILNTQNKKLLKKAEINETGPFSVTVLDINNDGKLDIVLSQIGGNDILVYDFNGLEWKFPFKNMITVEPTFSDIDNDKKVEIVAGTEQGVYVLDSSKNKKPIAYFKSPEYGFVGKSIDFDASESYDPEDRNNIQLRWDFNNDGIYDTKWTQEKISNHIFLKNRTYTIKLQVMDSKGEKNSTTRQIKIYSSDKPPEPHIEYYPENPQPDTKVDFISNSKDREDLTDLSVRWDFDGDGFYDTDWTKNKTVEHIYSHEGTYTVTLQAKDSSGLTSKIQKKINIAFKKENTQPVKYKSPNRTLLITLVSVLFVFSLIFLIRGIKKVRTN